MDGCRWTDILREPDRFRTHRPAAARERFSGSYIDEFEDEELRAVGFVEAVNLGNVRAVSAASLTSSTSS
jgi:hypothetical protein